MRPRIYLKHRLPQRIPNLLAIMPSRTRNTFTTSKFFRTPKSPPATAHPFYRVPNSSKEYDAIIDLAPYNPFLYRVSHRTSGSFYFKGQGVVAREHYSLDPLSQQRFMTSTIETLLSQTRGFGSVDREKLLRYVEYDKSECTNYISTSFSLPWTLFFAEMNYCNWNEEDVELIIIDTLAVADRAWCTLAELGEADPERRKIMNAAFSGQEIIVFDCIPESAIISRLSWSRLRESLPSWYFYEPSLIGSRKCILLSDDNHHPHRCKSWQQNVHARFIELSKNMRCLPMEWKRIYRLESLNFVLFFLSSKNNNIAEQLSSGEVETVQKTTRAITVASRSLLNWARNDNSNFHLQELLDKEDDYELEKLLRFLFPCEIPNMLSRYVFCKYIS